MCARVFAVCSFALEDKGGGVHLVYAEHLSLGVGVFFNRRRDRRIVCVFSIFLHAGGSVRVCTCVYTHTHAHTPHMGYTM